MAYTQFYRIEGGGGVPPPTITFDRVDEIQKIFLGILLSVRLGAGIITFLNFISSFRSYLLGACREVSAYI